ncbi:Glycosyltransferase involved in cell wall bisynthesis [Mucilaginibacter pineti]|uniref:Glycosyltransferase involved in cell wall bisynthesis n=1 Tax=Mucilaginibacter pineti TaxID=1391627 RepID=A0A1G6Z025_9SPHI|nr:glycosyltransferase family 1 protein [Mucilaginibacter pineti]SDD95948.1 Glycosyltransferase involved in cell wall bisynthesis [Mucilaginibacter pineti]
MKIFFDCTYLRNKHTGVDVYFFNLIHHLLLIDHENEYTILVDTRYDTNNLLAELNAFENYRIIRVFSPLPLQVFYASFLIPFYLRLKKFDIYHNPYFFGPLLKFVCNKTKIVITVHDLYHRTVPEMMNRYLNVVFKVFGDSAIKKADEVIVISNQTQSDVANYLKIPQNKLNLIYQALDHRFDTTGFKAGDIDKFNLTNAGYILSVGKVLPSKGFDDLIRAFKIFTDQNHEKDIILVIAGMHTGQYILEIEALIKTLDLKPDLVKLPGYVDDKDLVCLYANCDMVICPSHYEGFGFTVLEGMRFKKPVIARNASSLIEITGNAGLLFNTVNELVVQIKKIITDASLRNSLIEKGTERLKIFSWIESSKKTLHVYNKPGIKKRLL